MTLKLSLRHLKGLLKTMKSLTLSSMNTSKRKIIFSSLQKLVKTSTTYSSLQTLHSKICTNKYQMCLQILKIWATQDRRAIKDINETSIKKTMEWIIKILIIAKLEVIITPRLFLIRIAKALSSRQVLAKALTTFLEFLSNNNSNSQERSTAFKYQSRSSSKTFRDQWINHHKIWDKTRCRQTWIQV